MTDLQHIVLIGAGNVATHLGLALKKRGINISQVYSRTLASAEQLAIQLGCEATCTIESINMVADLYIFAVSDDALELLSQKVNLPTRLVVHTSGSLPMDVLSSVSANIGVLYPLQTFSKERETHFQAIPICIETNKPANLEMIRKLAKRLSADVREVNSEQRRRLHLAAVFACNFSNFMLVIADELLKDAEIDFDILLPLIEETARKAFVLNPLEAQTGPAWRGDQKVMEQHLKMLAQWPAYRELYKQISTEIVNKRYIKHE